MNDAKRQRIIEGVLISALGVIFVILSGVMGQAEGIGILWGIVGAGIGIYGIYHIYAGVSSVSITVKCNKCGKANMVRKDQKSYTCKDCGEKNKEIVEIKDDN